MLLLLFLLLVSCSKDTGVDNHPTESNVTVTLSQEQIEIEYNKKQGAIIILAINKYYDDNNSFPNSLGELIPKYVSSLPITYDSSSFGYKRNDYYGYLLSFELSNSKVNGSCGYSHRTPDWECSVSVEP